MTDTNEFAPLRYWRTLRAEADSDGSGTNWYAAWPRPERDFEMVADNDNEAPPTEIEMELKEDSAEALIRRLADVETTIAADGRKIIVGGDIEYSSTTGRLVRAGNLVFADFTKRHPFSKTPRAGELLGARTTSGRIIPLDVRARYRPRKAVPPPPTPGHVPGHAAFEARDELVALLTVVDERHVRVLDAALQAKNMEALGRELGAQGDYARKAGRAALRRAVAALTAGLEEITKKVAV